MANDQKIYPVDLLSQVAAQILTDANQALEQHQTIWKQVQTFLQDNDVDGKMAAVLDPHQQRMVDSYNWQIQLAKSISSAVEQVKQADSNMAGEFNPQ